MSITRKAITQIGNHLARIGGKSVTRIDASEQAWSIAYKIEIPAGATWGQVSAALDTMSDDKALMKEIGKRGAQVIAEMGLHEMRGRYAYREYASMSQAVNPSVAFSQAAALSHDYGRRYKNAKVFSITLYFR